MARAVGAAAPDNGRSPMLTLRRCLLACTLLLSGHSSASADQIIQLHEASQTKYRAGATSVQGVRPHFLQRGVNLDGTLRQPSAQGWALAANPFGEGWNSTAVLGALRLDTGTVSLTEVDMA